MNEHEPRWLRQTASRPWPVANWKKKVPPGPRHESVFLLAGIEWFHLEDGSAMVVA
jgi:hypothetical protein